MEFVATCIVVITDEAGVVYIWDSFRPEVFKQMGAHERAVTSASFFPDGERLVTTSHDGTAVIWSASSAERLHVLRGHVPTGIVGARVFPLGDKVLTFSRGFATVWNASSGKSLRVLGEGRLDHELLHVQVSFDGANVLIHSRSQIGPAEWVSLWSVASGEQLSWAWPLVACHQCTVALLEEDKVVVCEQDRRRLMWAEAWRVLDAKTGECLHGCASRGAGSANAVCLAVSQDGRRVAEGTMWSTEVVVRSTSMGGPAPGDEPSWLARGIITHAAFFDDGSKLMLFESCDRSWCMQERAAYSWDIHMGADPRRIDGLATVVGNDIFASHGALVAKRLHERLSVWDSGSARLLFNLPLPIEIVPARQRRLRRRRHIVLAISSAPG